MMEQKACRSEVVGRLQNSVGRKGMDLHKDIDCEERKTHGFTDSYTM